MKFTRSSAALLLFVAIANCVPVATNVVASASITQSTFPTTVTLTTGNSVQSNCKSVQIVDLGTGNIVETTDCSPDDSGVNNSDSSSNSASTTASDTGATVIATSTTDASSTVTLSPSQTASSTANNSTSDGSVKNTSTDIEFGLRDNGVGTSIIDRNFIPASQLNANSTEQLNDQSDAGREKGKRNVVMSNVKLTPDGPVSENCQIQLIPQANGEYTEMQTCELSIQSKNATVASSAVPSSTPEAITPSSVTSDPVPETPSPVSPSSSPQSSPASSSSVSTTPTSPAPVSSLSPSSDPVSSAPGTSSPAGDGAIALSTGLTSLSLPTASVSALGSLSSDNSSSNGTAAADSAAAFAMPGKHLSVLPVGLAVFAGVSVIALVVVGVVTHERTKYRKNFRRRQLAEQLKARAAPMSERSLV